MSRTEPDLPSIRTPLAQEFTITNETDRTMAGDGLGQVRSDAGPDRETETLLPTTEQTDNVTHRARSNAGRFRDHGSDLHELAVDQVGDVPGVAADPGLATSQDEVDEPQERTLRAWPRTPNHELPAQQRATEQLDRDETIGWEP